MVPPRARRVGLIVHELPQETLLYDPRTQRAHYLGRAAALVWSRCDGRTSVAEMAETLRREMNMPADECLVGAALEQLRRVELLGLEADPLAPGGS
jgi:hypothetical protein